jgi:1-acyl-sn-glycerol-3-phosphate acyltransferase
MRGKSSFELPFGFLRLLAWCILRPWFRFKIRGGEHLAGCSGPRILAGNHTGYLDSPALLAACPRYFQFLMTEEVFGWGLLGKLVRYGNIIPLYTGREKRGLVEALRVLEEGGTVCIFPEGKLTQDGHLNPFNEGVAFLQQKSGVPIVPFWIEGGFDAWPQTRAFPKFQQRVVLQFGQPLEAAPCQPRSEVVSSLQECLLAMRDEIVDTLPVLPMFSCPE